MGFGATFRNRDVFDHPVLSSGVKLSGALAGEFTIIQAAHADNMSYREFSEQPMDYQRLLVAHHLVSQRIEAVQAYDQNRKMKRAGRRK